MPGAMIISLGGTPEPVVASIAAHRPEAVCFFVSEKTVELVGPVKEHLWEKGISFADAKVLCYDIDDLVHCYERALFCDVRLREIAPGLNPDAVVVDYTGGTKTMTAALALATVGKGYRFSYVGGRERTKAGVGTVVSGTEFVMTGIHPFHLFAVEEKHRIGLYFNRYQFTAAAAAIRHLPAALPERERRLFACLSDIVEGYAAWDRFDHKQAHSCLGRGATALSVYADAAGDEVLRRFCAATQENLTFLQRLVKQKQPDADTVVDLLSNARRRYEEGKYDDAAARLYRSLELVGQIAFRAAFGCDTGDVPAEKIPEPLQEAYVCRYTDRDTGRLKLGLYAAFHALASTEHPTGLAFLAAEREIQAVLSTRNASILAHGMTPVKQDTFEQLDALIRSTFGIRDVVRFPALEW